MYFKRLMLLSLVFFTIKSTASSGPELSILNKYFNDEINKLVTRGC
ncbi:hypothetical protein SAMN02745724_03771 [Pseudoalteromonas denitrificans DSM 6059]|uniref:Uncharacterized protein n=1 Tax=Pseudoalteromonas denitrificans DSM 6059 TaxID=1123010 RepID=A0A1I1Q7S9_9GAMM|nr:hypothetical protein SAMN02745724_03771 [Pseudoalteromonas denitrificans DSM 6059]